MATEHERPTTRRREEIMCDNCPFAPSGPGARLGRSLRPGRMAEIKRAVLSGSPFLCHKTTDEEAWSEDGDSYNDTGRERVCGGSLAWLRRAVGRRASA